MNLPKTIHFIETGTGDSRACMTSLSSHATAKAMVAWFVHQDLIAMKQWFYLGGNLTRAVYRMVNDTFSPGGKMLALLPPLLSDNDVLVNWFVDRKSAYDLRRVENHKTHDFWAYQAIIAIQGDWQRLKSRCVRVLADPPTASGEKKYLLDHQFYLALAEGDTPAMEDAIRQIITPRARLARAKDESGFTEDLISTPAVIYAKIAWRHGYHVMIDSPFLPQQWLPIAPLDSYRNHYDFLA
ncbi:Imm49 family immunity protein [Paraburkholderia sp. EG287B]|uniref:Imm49 family immunity protein n=1 Tax=Paraburkholderia sp. EG287B TaxID=3237010 RepID=UPI0034D32E78